MVIDYAYVEEKAREIIRYAQGNGRKRLLWVLPSGQIKHYPEDGAEAARFSEKNNEFLIGLYDARADFESLVADILGAMK